MLSGRRLSNHARCQFYPSAVLYSAGYSSRATGSLLVWRIRSLQTPPSNSAYIMSMPMRNVRMGRDGGDSRGIRTYMPIVGVANTSVAVVVLYLAVMSLKKATAENAKGLHICCTSGDSHATIMTVQCPKTFNLCSVIVNRESLNRLCGYGAR